MGFCPKCRYEYEPTLSVCPDCEEQLVAELPPLADGEEVLPEEIKDWVHLARLTGREYALMIEERFNDRGIPVVVLSGAGYFGQTGQLGPSSYQPIGGGYSVYVPENFVVAADIEGTAILGETWAAARLVDIEQADSTDGGSPREDDTPDRT